MKLVGGDGADDCNTSEGLFQGGIYGGDRSGSLEQ